MLQVMEEEVWALLNMKIYNQNTSKSLLHKMFGGIISINWLFCIFKYLNGSINFQKAYAKFLGRSQVKNGGGGDLGGGRSISWNDPLLTRSSIFVFIEKALPTDRPTDGPTDGWTDPLIEMRGRI